MGREARDLGNFLGDSRTFVIACPTGHFCLANCGASTNAILIAPGTTCFVISFHCFRGTREIVSSYGILLLGSL